MANETALTIMSREMLGKKDTKRLLNILRRVTAHISYLRNYGCDFCGGGWECHVINAKVKPYDTYKKLLKSILATREHVGA